MQFLWGCIVASDFLFLLGNRKQIKGYPLDPSYNDGTYFTGQEINFRVLPVIKYILSGHGNILGVGTWTIELIKKVT